MKQPLLAGKNKRTGSVPEPATEFTVVVRGYGGVTPWPGPLQRMVLRDAGNYSSLRLRGAALPALHPSAPPLLAHMCVLSLAVVRFRVAKPRIVAFSCASNGHN